jgi:hypothetical protein
MTIRNLVAAGAIVLGAGLASAGNHDITKQPPQTPNGHRVGHHGTYKPVEPRFEHFYIKRYPQPQINCGACFGYYKPQWKSWAEACNEPVDVVTVPVTAADAKPTTPEMAPKPATPEVTPKPMVPVDPKPVDPKPADIKPAVPEIKPAVPEIKPAVPEIRPADPKPSVPAPGKSTMAPVNALPVSITIPVPAAVEAPSIPLIPPLPEVNVK